MTTAASRAGRRSGRRCSVCWQTSRRARPVRSAARALDRTAFETKPYLEGYLELRLALGIHSSADVLDLEPFEIAQCLAGLFERVAHGLMNALFGYPDHVDYFVGFIGHGISSWRLLASPAVIWRRQSSYRKRPTPQHGGPAGLRPCSGNDTANA